jgi:hypothetical protein
LYTKDYINFVTQDKVDGSYIYEESADTRQWFKTTHINLYVEYGGIKYLADYLTASVGSAVSDIVNLYMPVNLVLRNFGMYLELNTVDTAPALYFCGTIDSIAGTKTVTSSFFDPAMFRG